jgi:hypothetical protein
MVKLKELKQLADILGERLKDKNPNETLIQRCLEPVWHYIYPFGLLSYLNEHAGDPPEKIDQLKMEKLLRAITGSRRKWRSFLIGLCHTYRERHSLARARARLIKKAVRKGAPLSSRKLDDLAEKFREQALLCARAIEEAKLELFDFEAATERIKLAQSVRNDENIPRFLQLSRYLDFDKLLDVLPAEFLDGLRSRYEKHNPQTLFFDALQEYIALDDDLWKQFKETLLASYGNKS